MNNYLILFLVFCLTIYIFALFFLVRNNQVHEYRIKLIKEIKIKDLEDIKKERNYKWRLNEFNKISYDEMLFKFWIQLYNFYGDKFNK